MHLIVNIDTGFETEISALSEYRETESNTENILCYTDGSKMNDMVGAGVFVPDIDGNGTSVEKSYHIGEHSTVFQAETFAVEQAAKLLADSGTKNKTIIINCDSQAAIKAVDSTVIKSRHRSRSPTLSADRSLPVRGHPVRGQV